MVVEMEKAGKSHIIPRCNVLTLVSNMSGRCDVAFWGSGCGYDFDPGIECDCSCTGSSRAKEHRLQVQRDGERWMAPHHRTQEWTGSVD